MSTFETFRDLAQRSPAEAVGRRRGLAAALAAPGLHRDSLRNIHAALVGISQGLYLAGCCTCCGRPTCESSDLVAQEVQA